MWSLMTIQEQTPKPLAPSLLSDRSRSNGHGLATMRIAHAVVVTGNCMQEWARHGTCPTIRTAQCRQHIHRSCVHAFRFSRSRRSLGQSPLLGGEHLTRPCVRPCAHGGIVRRRGTRARARPPVRVGVAHARAFVWTYERDRARARTMSKRTILYCASACPCRSKRAHAVTHVTGSQYAPRATAGRPRSRKRRAWHASSSSTWGH